MASLGRRTISLNFVSGIDQKTDQKLTGKLTTADNVVLRKNGTIEKRPGFVADGTWGATFNPVRALPFRDGIYALTEAVSMTGSAAIRGRQVAIGRAAGVYTGAPGAADVFVPCEIKTRTLVSTFTSITYGDGCLINCSATQRGTYVFAAKNSFFQCDLDTGNVAEGKAFGSGSVVRMLSLTSSSTVAYAVVGGGTRSSTSVFVMSLAAGTSAAVTVATINGSSATALSTMANLDAVAVGTKIYFATPTASSTGIILASYDTATSATSTTTVPASTTADALCIATPAPSTDRLHLFWLRNTASNTGFMASYSLTLSQILAATSITTITASYGPGLVRQIAAGETFGNTSVYLYVTASSTTTMPDVTAYSSINLSGTVTSAFTVGKPTSIASRPFLGETAQSVFLNNTATGQQCLFAVAEVGAQVWPSVARCFYGTAGASFTALCYQPSVSKDPFGNYYVVQRRASAFSAAAGSVTVSYALELVECNFSQTSQALPRAAVGGSTLVGSGFLAQFDARGPIPLGFLSSPVINTVSITTSGGSLTTGVYGVVVVKESTDWSGRTIVGAPSLPYTFTVSATNSSATVAFNDPIISTAYNRDSPALRYVVYRTAANGSIYYRDTFAAPSFGVAADLPSISTSITISDASLSGGSVIYTQGGVLPYWSPDGCDLLFSHGVRVFCSDPTEETILRFSNEINQGEAVTFALSSVIRFPGQGRLTAGASLDSNGVVFRSRSIYAFNGSGPDDTGQNGTFSEGQLLYADVGCINQRNLCRFRDGIVFKSPDKGFYLLTRDLQLQFIGAEVEGYNSKTVVSSEVVAMTEASGAVEECRFLCSDGTLLTYNYYNGQWTTATLAGCTDAVQTGGRYVVVNTSSTAANARVFQQSLTTYLDAFSNTSTTYQMTVETGWIKTADVQGFQRIWKGQLLGEAHGPGAISVEIGYDYETAYNESYTFQMSSMTTPNYTGGAASAPQCDFVPVRQKCQAIRFRIKDYPGATGTVMKLTNISLECGVKSGVFKLPAAKGS